MQRKMMIQSVSTTIYRTRWTKNEILEIKSNYLLTIDQKVDIKNR